MIPEPGRLLRKLLLLVMLVGMGGTAVELVLLEHYEDFWQKVPLAMLGIGFLLTGVSLLRPSRGTVRVLQALMLLFLFTGLLGVYQHYSGNVEFELEMYPTLSGLELFREAMTGATPALAPGAIAQLGLVGLVACFRHPLLLDRAGLGR